MQTHLRGRDVISDLDLSVEEVQTVLDVAFDLKMKQAMGIPHRYLEGKTMAMLFFYSSTRTRASFEAGLAQLGGHPAFIESKTTQIAHGDTAKEIGEIYGRYFDAIAIRHVDWGWVTAISPKWPATAGHRSSTCSAISTTPSRSWRT
jgi:ornithine carbamoyltransferase